MTSRVRWGQALSKRGELRRCVDHLLEVVNDEQQLPLADVLGEAVAGAEGARNRLCDERRVAKRGEADPEDARLEGGDERGGGLDRDPRLPRPAGAGQGDESVAALDPGANVRELAFPADEGARWPGQVRVRDRLQRREALAADLEDRDGLVDVLEAVLAEVGEHGAVGESRRRPREDDLTAVRGCRHPGRDVDVLADVALRGQEGLAGVDADANPDRAGRERLGQSRRRGNGGRCGREGEEERVSLRVHLDAVVVSASLADQPAMLRQLLGVSLCAELAQQARRALDVGEEERDRARR